MLKSAKNWFPDHVSRFTGIGLVFLFIMGICLACAEIGAPPGGEEDKRGPVILSVEPASGAVNVTRTDKIILRFSEPVQRPTSGQPLFLSPRQGKPPKISWKSDRVEIKLADSLAPNQTYIISLSSGITDLRNNRIDSLAPIAFSTGAALDSGSLVGEIFDDRKPVGGAVVALYDSLPADSIPFDSVTPQYLTSSNTDGRFALKYLPRRPFFLIAFQDKNNNGQFNPSTERFAVPDRPVDLRDTAGTPSLRLQLSAAAPRTQISDVAYSNDGLIRVRFIAPVATRYVATHPGEAQIWSISDSSRSLYGQAVAQSEMDTSRTFDIWFGPISPSRYTGRMKIDSMSPPLVFDTFEVKAADDKTPPKIIASTPTAGAHFRENLLISFAFSEPIDTAASPSGSLFLVANETDTLPLARQWSDLMHLKLLPAEFGLGTDYRLVIPKKSIVDLHGNAVGDSILQINFATYSPDSVGSASGDVTVAPGVDATLVRLHFVRLVDKQEFNLPLAGSHFTLPLPAGRYLLSGFIDANGDGRLFKGSIFPYRLAETLAHYPDTIAVRARFETAGIHFEIR